MLRRATLNQHVLTGLFHLTEVRATVTVIEDSANSCYYIVYYINRTYDGADDDSIKSTVLNKKYSEYIKKYTDEYSVNVKKRFSYK